MSVNIPMYMVNLQHDVPSQIKQAQHNISHARISVNALRSAAKPNW